MNYDKWKLIRAAGEISSGTALLAYPEPATSAAGAGLISAGVKDALDGMNADE